MQFLGKKVRFRAKKVRNKVKAVANSGFGPFGSLYRGPSGLCHRARLTIPNLTQPKANFGQKKLRVWAKKVRFWAKKVRNWAKALSVIELFPLTEKFKDKNII